MSTMEYSEKLFGIKCYPYEIIWFCQRSPPIGLEPKISRKFQSTRLEKMTAEFRKTE